MTSVLVIIVRCLLALVVVRLICLSFKRVTHGGLSELTARIGTDCLDAVKFPFTLLFKLIKGTIQGLFKAVVDILMAIMQLPLTLAWNVIPGLSTICDCPDVRSVMMKSK